MVGTNGDYRVNELCCAMGSGIRERLRGVYRGKQRRIRVYRDTVDMEDLPPKNDCGYGDDGMMTSSRSTEEKIWLLRRALPANTERELEHATIEFANLNVKEELKLANEIHTLARVVAAFSDVGCKWNALSQKIVMFCHLEAIF